MPNAAAMIVTLLCVQVAISDLYARKVLNGALLASLLVGAIAIGLQLNGSPSPSQALIGLLCGLALLPFYAFRLMGAGDVKFFGTLGFLLGWQAMLPIWVAASLMAGLHAVVILSSSRLLNFIPAPLRISIAYSQRRLDATPFHQRMLAARQGRQGIPYAAYLAFASLALIWKGLPHG
ncbi:A24 family peptidase [Pseudomonas sp. Hp2]|uniref:A24 family peptidase n=1 Tax=Pseudomonas sp. Hp2 TaxID=701189 RepID=UPI001C49BE22|nr:prepilin peptidase [Pseudomonas sp. Hp2]